jgi:steroid 5-alpha reductase family enzyme
MIFSDDKLLKQRIHHIYPLKDLRMRSLLCEEDPVIKYHKSKEILHIVEIVLALVLSSPISIMRGIGEFYVSQSIALALVLTSIISRLGGIECFISRRVLLLLRFSHLY